MGIAVRESSTRRFPGVGLDSRRQNERVIVAVEGPSAAGKTTWCLAHGGRFVPEYVPTGKEPDGRDLDAQADHWVQVNSGRWAQALELERAAGVAICDSDPLKLHYSWSLAVIGAAPWDRFRRELQRCRLAFATGSLGLADLVLFSTAPQEQLRHQKAADRSRRRRSFDLHVRLREPLLAWYTALERSSPGRVLWALPDDNDALMTTGPRVGRTDPALLDALVEQLPMP